MMRHSGKRRELSGSIAAMGGASRNPGALAWLRDALRSQGLLRAMRSYGRATMELLHDLTPERRRSRFGDIDFDIEHGVDTTWARVSLRTRLRELLSGGQYQPSEPALFHQMLAALPVPVDGFTFIDLGSGKGRTLLMASDYPFRRIIGVELLSELHEIAKQNIARYRSDAQRCTVIESRAGDARQFDFPAEPTLLYLFNPFPEHVLRAGLRNLHASLLRSPRQFYIIYHNLVLEHVFSEQPWLNLVLRTHEFAIYGRATTDH